MRPFCRVVRKVGRRVPPRQYIQAMFDSKALARKRMDAGYTQQQLARELGVSPRTLHNWETGATSPEPAFWHRLNAFLAA